MKWSKYNYFFKSNKYGYLLYNALTNIFLRLNESDADLLEMAKINPCLIEEFADKDLLVKSKIFVDSDEDELAKLKVENLLYRFSSDHLSLTITPTLDCNFRCRYCYEKSHQETYMTEEVQDKVVDFVRRFKALSQIDISWYGGEPLLALDIVERLSKALNTLNLPIHHAMVTNGYLLTENVVLRLLKLSILSIQITIDGLGDVHNKRRPHLSDRDSFSTIISNIDRLFELTDEIFVAIRVNIDNSNKDDFPEIASYMLQRYQGKKLVVVPAFVEQINGCCNQEQCIESSKAKADYWHDLFVNHGVYYMDSFPKLQIGSCMVRKLNAYVISYDGKLYKCWNDVGQPDKAVGSVMKEGLNTTLLSRYLKAADKWDDPICLQCAVFPICDGGCAYMRLENLYENAHHDCCIAAKDRLPQFMENHYEMRKLMEIKTDKK